MNTSYVVISCYGWLAMVDFDPKPNSQLAQTLAPVEVESNIAPEERSQRNAG